MFVRKSLVVLCLGSVLAAALGCGKDKPVEPAKIDQNPTSAEPPKGKESVLKDPGH